MDRGFRTAHSAGNLLNLHPFNFNCTFGTRTLCSDVGGSDGGSGAFGIYIQANKIIAGTINAAGQNGGMLGSGGGGGGGGGTILLAYGSGGYVEGTYNTNGGLGGLAGPNGGAGGSGGAGQVLTLNYGSSPPVAVEGSNQTAYWGFCFNAGAAAGYFAATFAYKSCIVENSSAPTELDILTFSQTGLPATPTGDERQVLEDIANDLLNNGALSASVEIDAVGFQSSSGEALNAQPYSFVNASLGVGIGSVLGASGAVTLLQNADQNIAGFFYGISAGFCLGCIPSPVTLGVSSGTLNFSDVQYILPAGAVNPVDVMRSTLAGLCLAIFTPDAAIACPLAAAPIVGPSGAAWVSSPSSDTSVTNFAYWYRIVNNTSVPIITQSSSPSSAATITYNGITVTAEGQGTISLSQYSPDVTFAPSFSSPAIHASGQYFDVGVEADSSFSSLTITDCNLVGGSALEWWNGTSWAQVSPQSYSPTEACATATLTNSSSPTLSELTGTPFVAVISVAALDGPYQVRYAANLDKGESYINIINTGANGAPLLGSGFGTGGIGNICVNVYAISPDEQLDACCSCLITPDAVVNLGVNRDILVNTLTGAPETSMTLLLVGTLPGVSGVPVNCSSSAALLTVSAVVGGYTAFGTTLHAMPGGVSYFVTETPFIPAAFGTSGTNSQLTSLSGRCASILGNGGGFGICRSCQAGALGAAKQY